MALNYLSGELVSYGGVYLPHIIKVLWPRDARGLRRGDVIERIWSIRNSSGLPMPKAFEETALL
jgi:hypothetical protein